MREPLQFKQMQAQFAFIVCLSSLLPLTTWILATSPGGDLQLVSMPGYGVDAFLSLQHLEGDWQEPLAEHQSAPFEAEQAPLSAYP